MYEQLIENLKHKKIINHKNTSNNVAVSPSPITISSTKNEMIDKSNLVKVKEMGRQLELCYTRTVPTEMPFERIDENTYIIKNTGEVKEFKKSETRDEQVKSLKRTFKKLRELINTNFQGLENEKFITLTYKKNQRDHEQVYKDFKVWVQAVRRKYGECDYINVVEPQGRGSWHCHVLIKFYELPNNYINYNEFRKLLKNGSYVNVRTLENCDNIGAYLSAYLSDIELDDKTFKKAMSEMSSVKVKEVTVDGQKKSFIKGGRLSYYPKGMNIYRISKGIKQPTEYFKIKDELDLDNYELRYTNKMELKRDEEILNTIHYESYTKI